jgi:hypothetical protein
LRAGKRAGAASNPSFNCMELKYNAVIWDTLVEYDWYMSHHEEHEDHKGKHIILILFFRALRGYGCLT